MAGVHVEINDTAIVNALNRLLESGGNLTPAFQEFGDFMESELQEQFQDSKDAYGFPWSPSKRAQNEANAKTLVEHGHLRDSFHPVVTSETLIFGSNAVYAAIHQFGGETGRNHKTTLPARPMLPDDGWPTVWEEEIVDILTEHLGF